LRFFQVLKIAPAARISKFHPAQTKTIQRCHLEVSEHLLLAASCLESAKPARALDGRQLSRKAKFRIQDFSRAQAR